MKITIPLISTLLFISIWVALASCDLLGSDEKKEMEPELEPGSRNYSWEIDTLSSSPGGFVYNIWGSSEDDVWAVLGTGLNTLWHFDGQSWTPWSIRVSPSLYSIYGFAKNDVWMGGNDGKIYHFNGNSWSLSYTYEPAGFRHVDFDDIRGTSPTNIYFIGSAIPNGKSYWSSFILHYDGKNWKELFTTEDTVFFHRIRIQGDSKLIQARKQKPNGNDSLFIYRIEGNSLKEVMSSTKSQLRNIGISKIGDYIYSFTETSIYKYNGSKFEDYLSLPEVGEIVRIDGRHEKDLFIHNWTTTYHYNGEDITPVLQELPRNVFRSHLFEREVFFVIRDFINGWNLVSHGILTEEEEE